jgi:dTDP-4-dehydrorhamnose reductase
MKVLLTGGSGQLGRALIATQPDGLDLITPSSRQLDMSRVAKLAASVQEIGPDAILNAAAYTAVDRAESEPELAQRINGDAVGILAGCCRRAGIPFIHVSTDFVFSGEHTLPYIPADATAPLNVYGASKLAGEQAAFAANPESYVIRTSWVYSEHGQNFVKTMLRLAREGNSLRVVDDQVGSPTYARNLASYMWRVFERQPAERLLHYADDGQLSWYEFATAIMELSVELGLLDKLPQISPVPGSAYETAAQRPAYSVLDCSSSLQALGLQAVDWRVGLRAMLERLADDTNFSPISSE